MAGTLSWRAALTDRPWHVYSLLLAFFWLVCAYVDHIFVTILACIIGGMASEVIADLWPIHKTGKTQDKSREEEHFESKPLPPEPVERQVVHHVEERFEKPLEEHFNEPVEDRIEHHVEEHVEKYLHEPVEEEAPCYIQVRWSRCVLLN